MPRADITQLQKSIEQLGEVVIDPGRWKGIIADISHSVSSTGAILLSGQNRTREVPMSDGITDLMNAYFDGGFHIRDIRAERSVPLILRGQLVIDDTDIVKPEEMARDPMYNVIARLGYRWFAAVGFRAGGAVWGLTIHRKKNEGMFTPEEKQLLLPLSQKLSEVSTLSTAIGQAALEGAVNALEMIKHAAIAIDRFGNVLEVNGAAAGIFDDEFYMKGRRLVVRDSAAEQRIDTLLDQLANAPDLQEISCAPIVVRKKAGPPLVIRVLPVHPAAKIPFLGARALFVIAPPEKVRSLRQASLMEAYRLTRAEARLAGEIASGESVENIATKFGVSRETIRNQLKSVFSKTGTSRQIELVLLLNQFRD